MLKLVTPSPVYLQSYLEACREFKELGLLSYSLNDPDDYEKWAPDLFRGFEDNRLGRNLKEGYVPATTLWLVDEDKKEFLGEGSIRHELTPALMCFGGHIGYAIRAGAWNKGYGTMQLSLLLREAASLGIESALVTCNDSNIGSWRVIEKNGGEYLDTVDNNIGGKMIRTRRYWVKTIV
ncbi:MAG: GNAT family N-acetyltransferase [Defluviitaleaceae bacterium]|nr:GNAT family N-acetyltransferase [Defluviitaleaceae bacterium]MCL2836166.1 GNAT family N-acetyltransferase [Defluviitaleaceae bacterium]